MLHVKRFAFKMKALYKSPFIIIIIIKGVYVSGGKMERLQLPGHLDIRNPNSFEIKDLEHLIKKVGHGWNIANIFV